MPTARELLEQADALMRRNRSVQVEDIPTLTDAVPSPAELKSRGASGEQGEPARKRDDEIPVLTDEVEEIEAPALADDLPYEDEPSIWPETLRGARSIIEEPDETTAVASPLEAPAPVPTQDRGRTQTPQAAARSEPSEPARPAAPPVELAVSLPEEFGRATPPAKALIDFDEDVVLRSAIDATQPRATAAAALANYRPVVAAPSEPIRPPVDALEEVLAPTAPEPQPEPIPSKPADDEARWTALSEEIRMQVLQRIDLFTDTGLREQLGERLKPIVDRASADLVATINQHVGELLRAYVAEAIEREIERWRDAH